MEGIAADVGTFHFPIGYDDPLGIVGTVPFAADGQSGVGCRGADQIDDDAVADQGLRTKEPVVLRC